jgi:uncharacterized protein
MLWHAKTLVDAGFGILMYDERASGESGGYRRSYGWEDGPDVGGAIKYIKERSGDKSPHIGICGCSIGGQIALQGAFLYPEIEAVWADGPANILAIDSPPPHSLQDALMLASNYMLDFLYQNLLHIQAPSPMIVELAGIAPRPVMFVGGGTNLGPFGSETDRVKHFAGFAGKNAQVWIIPDAVHCDGPQKQPEEYARRLVQFFENFLGVKN